MNVTDAVPPHLRQMTAAARTKALEAERASKVPLRTHAEFVHSLCLEASVNGAGRGP